MSAVNIAEELNVAVPDRADATTTHTTRPFLWSIRRELWESPTIIGAPVAIASIAILSILFAAVRFHGQLLQVEVDNSALSNMAVLPLLPVPFVLGVAMVGVAILYSLDALLSERRERTILFWKSLPVSDTLAVLSKMAVPMLILPVVTFILAIASEIAIFIIEMIVLLAHHASVSSAWDGIPLLPFLGLMVYTLVVVTLWYAPIYAWCMLVSAWARRAALLWAVIPFFALAFFERLAYQTHYVRDFINSRFLGFFSVAFINEHTAHSHHRPVPAHITNDSLATLWTPGHFLATPALWLGLLFTALALILIIRLRRSSDPL